MHYQQDEYPPLTRRRLASPFAIFGRGRMLSFVMMAVVSIFSFLSNNRGSFQPTVQPGNVAGSYQNPNAWQGGLSTDLARQQMEATRMQANQRQQILSPKFDPVRYHGGVVEDQRATYVRQVGDRLVRCVRGLDPNSVRFYVLQDNARAASYVASNGSILVTVGLLNSHNQAQLAEKLSLRLTEVVFQGADRIQHGQQIAQYPAQLLQAAGYAGQRQVNSGRSQVLPVANTSAGNAYGASPISAGWAQ